VIYAGRTSQAPLDDVKKGSNVKITNLLRNPPEQKEWQGVMAYVRESRVILVGPYMSLAMQTTSSGAILQ
jgi:hypothetical protein